MLYKLLVRQFEPNTKNEPLRNEKGDILQEPDREDNSKSIDIIPTRIKTGEYTVYQEIDETGTQVVRNWTEDGKPFSFYSNKKSFEAFIIDEEPEIPAWYDKDKT